MRVVVGLIAAIVVPLAAAQTPPRPPRPLFRCEIASFAGAMSPGGATAHMIVVSDGLGCSLVLWGVPADRRNAATAGEITAAPEHGTASFLGASARYIADRGYVGPDAFDVRATARDADNIERTIVVRVEVDVRSGPFDRTTTGNVAMLQPVLPARVGNEIPVPRKIKDVRPVYPSSALAAGAQGVVVLDATIEPDGKVSTARVVRSVPFLDAAAISAVSQWEFTPTVIDGRAVPVIMTLSVGFKRPADASAPAASAEPTAPPAPPVAPPPPTVVAPPVASPSASAPTPVVVRPPAPRPSPPPAAARRSPADADLDDAFGQLQRRQYEEAVKAFRSANDRRAQKCAVCLLGMARAYEALGAARNVVDACDRELIDLSSLKGRIVLLDFWGTWCPPCVAAVPALRSLQKRHAKDPFVILGVSSDSDEAVVRAFVERHQMAWPQFWDRDRKVQQAFDVRAYPTYVVIDDEGVVRFRTTGGGVNAPAGLDDAIRKQLKAAASRAKTPQ
jgi:TonB family protein